MAGGQTCPPALTLPGVPERVAYGSRCFPALRGTQPLPLAPVALGARNYPSSPAMPLESRSQADSTLVQRLCGRDPDAMMAIYDKFGKLIFSVILGAVRDPAAAEDLTQETFLRVWNRISTFSEDKGNLEGWLITIARNRAFDYLRAVRNAPEMPAVALNDIERLAWHGPADDPANRLADRKVVLEALEKLNTEQRKVIEMTHFAGMTQTEIAARLNKPLGTVKGLVRSGLKVLRAAVAGVGLL